MRVLVDQHSVELGREHFVGSGGEGTVYARDGVAYKIFFDPTSAPKEVRIQELGRIHDSHVVGPESLVHSEAGTVIGHTLRFLPDHIPFCRLFTRSFRDTYDVRPEAIARLVLGLRNTLSAIHDAGVTVVDLNPMNLLVSPDLQHVFLIDTCSWQTPTCPATAVLDAVRDRHATTYCAKSDWFSFAVITFQAFIGIHPYRGTHPTVKGLDARMRAQSSVFDPTVTRPQICYPFNDIPPSWRSWYEGVLARGDRSPPPTSRGERIDRLPARQPAIGRSRRRNREVLATLSEGQLILKTVDDGRPIALPLSAREVTAHDGSLTVRTRSHLVHIHLHDVGGRVIASPTVIADILPNATRLFSGVAVLDLLGATWALLPRACGGCDRIRLPELDGVRIVDASRGDDHIAVTTFRDGALHRALYGAS
jgi:hypothetical protein